MSWVFEIARYLESGIPSDIFRLKLGTTEAYVTCLRFM